MHREFGHGRSMKLVSTTEPVIWTFEAADAFDGQEAAEGYDSVCTFYLIPEPFGYSRVDVCGWRLFYPLCVELPRFW